VQGRQRTKFNFISVSFMHCDEVFSHTLVQIKFSYLRFCSLLPHLRIVCDAFGELTEMVR
jgi:hypothetical protein